MCVVTSSRVSSQFRQFGTTSAEEEEEEKKEEERSGREVGSVDRVAVRQDLSVKGLRVRPREDRRV